MSHSNSNSNSNNRSRKNRLAFFQTVYNKLENNLKLTNNNASKRFNLGSSLRSQLGREMASAVGLNRTTFNRAGVNYTAGMGTLKGRPYKNATNMFNALEKKNKNAKNRLISMLYFHSVA